MSGRCAAGPTSLMPTSSGFARTLLIRHAMPAARAGRTWRFPVQPALGKGGPIKSLEALLDRSALGGVLPASADALDALVCVLAAADFMRGRAGPPSDLETARQEGWIWTAEAPEQT